MRTALEPRPHLSAADLAELASGGGPEPYRRWFRVGAVVTVVLLVGAGMFAATRMGRGPGADLRSGAPAATATPTPPAPAGPTESPITTPAVAGTASRPAAATTVTTVAAAAMPAAGGACRNSTDPACGPFRFDPQPGPDEPMTVQVTAIPALARVGQEVVFRVTLRDPDGVSRGSSLYDFGNSALGESVQRQCEKYGPWEPPARPSGPVTEVQEIRHTYAAPGTYTVTFAYGAEPFDCADAATGRGDRPYASSAKGTATIVVTP